MKRTSGSEAVRDDRQQVTPVPPRDLSAVNLKEDYRSGEDNLLVDFYIPCLQESCKYSRAVGFFSSSALSAAARGLAHFIKGSGEMRLIASPVLNEDDVKAMSAVPDPDDRKFLERIGEKLSQELDPKAIESLLVRRRLECLAWCQGRNEREPLGWKKREPVGGTIKQGFSGEKRLWSVAEEAFLPRSMFGRGEFSVPAAGSVCGGFA